MPTQQQDKITADMTIAEILSRFPHKSQKLAQTMTNAGLHCTNCSAATWETLEAGVLGHGMSEADLHKLLNDLNAILQEESNPSTISITPRAAKKLREFAKEDGHEDWALRFGDMAGGCGGFQYVLDFTNEFTPEDTLMESEGIRIYVKTVMLGRLLGCVIDYIDGLHGAGFKISNPNVKSSCGCGTSQGY